MSNKPGDVGAVSWELFNELYESQYDLLRKLKFITKAAKMNGGESIALELIEGYLRDKEIELKVLRDASLREWSGRETAPGAPDNNCDPGAAKALVPAGADT